MFKNLPLSKEDWIKLIPFYIFTIFFTLIFRNKPFFWDKDLMDSIQAHWFLNHSFNLSLPDEFDPGHPPFVGLLLATGWFLFGKSLTVSHLLMLPFSLGIVYQSYLLIKKICKKNIGFILTLLLADTSILSQMIIISSDLILLFFFLLCLNTILSEKRKLLSVGIVFLAIINNRGLLLCGSLLIFDIIILFEKNTFKQIIKNSLVYIPGFTVAGSYILFHFIKKGWIGYHENSPWAGCYERVPFQGMIRNAVIIIWRFFDYGRIIYLGFILFFTFKLLKGKYQILKELKPLIILLIIVIVINLPLMIISKNLLDHRYIIPCTFILTLIVLVTIVNYYKKPLLLLSLIFVFILGGSFIVYPDKIAQGWDATLAHVPYHTLHKKMLVYIDKKGIDLKTVGSVTPNKAKLKYIYLNNDERSFSDLDLNSNKYVFYSNIFNDLTDSEIDTLKTYWTVEKKFKLLNIKTILYKKP